MTDLKSVQAPIKARYRENPQTAHITLTAEGQLGEGISCKVATGKALTDAGLHPGVGGNGVQACSGEMLLEALVACAGVTLSSVATSMGLTVERGTLRAEGELDFRGTLGIDKTVPVGFRSIRLLIDIESPVTTEQRTKLLELTERYCVVYQTLKAGVPVTAGWSP